MGLKVDRKDYEDEWFDDLEKIDDDKLTTKERRHKYINDNNS